MGRVEGGAPGLSHESQITTHALAVAMIRMIYRTALGLLCAMTVLPSHAQTYPSRPIRLVAPFSAGGGADTVARLVGQKLSELLAQQVLVDNRPRAGNLIGTELVAKSAPYGYTIMIAINNHAISYEFSSWYGLLAPRAVAGTVLVE